MIKPFKSIPVTKGPLWNYSIEIDGIMISATKLGKGKWTASAYVPYNCTDRIRSVVVNQSGLKVYGKTRDEAFEKAILVVINLYNTQLNAARRLNKKLRMVLEE